ncbi:hypothetical protein [Nostoc sp. 'Peltigera membranacea cyanobiont' 232]|nr:hypothetical protein [Nostoc sp. 'Peltigera membranacea cyanobiont' 232]
MTCVYTAQVGLGCVDAVSNRPFICDACGGLRLRSEIKVKL